MDARPTGGGDESHSRPSGKGTPSEGAPKPYSAGCTCARLFTKHSGSEDVTTINPRPRAIPSNCVYSSSGICQGIPVLLIPETCLRVSTLGIAKCTTSLRDSFVAPCPVVLRFIPTSGSHHQTVKTNIQPETVVAHFFFSIFLIARPTLSK